MELGELNFSVCGLSFEILPIRLQVFPSKFLEQLIQIYFKMLCRIHAQFVEP